MDNTTKSWDGNACVKMARKFLVYNHLCAKLRWWSYIKQSALPKWSAFLSHYNIPLPSHSIARTFDRSLRNIASRTLDFPRIPHLPRSFSHVIPHVIPHWIITWPYSLLRKGHINFWSPLSGHHQCQHVHVSYTVLGDNIKDLLSKLASVIFIINLGI